MKIIGELHKMYRVAQIVARKNHDSVLKTFSKCLATAIRIYWREGQRHDYPEPGQAGHRKYEVRRQQPKRDYGAN